MATQIQLLETAKNGCKSATLPIVVQEPKITFNDALDGTAPTTITPTDPRAPYGGSFVNKGCADLEVTINYIDGGNCEACDDPDTLTPVPLTWVVPGNSISQIPDGFWVDIEYVLLTAANDSKPQEVSFQSCYTPDCPTCAVLLADAGGKRVEGLSAGKKSK